MNEKYVNFFIADREEGLMGPPFTFYVDAEQPEIGHAVKEGKLTAGWYASCDGLYFFGEVYATQEEAAKAAS
jgi:hypothetical protein